MVGSLGGARCGALGCAGRAAANLSWRGARPAGPSAQFCEWGLHTRTLHHTAAHTSRLQHTVRLTAAPPHCSGAGSTNTCERKKPLQSSKSVPGVVTQQQFTPAEVTEQQPVHPAARPRPAPPRPASPGPVVVLLFVCPFMVKVGGSSPAAPGITAFISPATTSHIQPV